MLFIATGPAVLTAVLPALAAAMPALPPTIRLSSRHISARAPSSFTICPPRSLASIVTVVALPAATPLTSSGKERALPLIGCSISKLPYSASSTMMS